MQVYPSAWIGSTLGRVVARSFYGADLALIHHEGYGDLARAAARHLLDLLRAAGHPTGTVVDLACGSGILAAPVSGAGYDVLGVDLSADMVELARANAPRGSFQQAALLDIELPPAVAVTAIGEALNYATDDRTGLQRLEGLFRRVRGALVPDGVLLFDVATPGRGGADPGRAVVVDRENWTMVMRVEEDADRSTLERRILSFRRTDAGTYHRSDEHHVLRLYTLPDVLDQLSRAGFAAGTLPGYRAPEAPGPWPGWRVIVARPR